MILNKQELLCLFGICGKEEMARCGTTNPPRANLWCINMIFSTKYGSEHKKIIITNAPHQFINTTTNKSHPGEAWALRATLNIVVNMGLTNVLYEMDNKLASMEYVALCSHIKCPQPELPPQLE
ncbi:hypothetical protein JHK84_052018 [Glycine max]|nr:hypothetical protein JHK84_052018 [Glycine max]